MNSRSMVSVTACPLWFLQPYVSGVCCIASVSSGVFVLRSPPELSIMPSTEGSFSHLRPLPAATPGVQYHRGLGLFGGQPLLLHSMGREQGWVYLRATPEFGVFWFIPPLLSKPIFGQPPLKGGFSSVYTRGRPDLSSFGVVRP